MSFIECYEPEYVRKFLARHPGSPLYARKVWENEIHLSLSLTDIAGCEAMLNDIRALDSQLTYRPVEDNSAELSARDTIVNQVILSTLTLRDLTPEFSLCAVGTLLSCANRMLGRDGGILARLAALLLTLADHVEKGTLQAQYA